MCVGREGTTVRGIAGRGCYSVSAPFTMGHGSKISDCYSYDFGRHAYMLNEGVQMGACLSGPNKWDHPTLQPMSVFDVYQDAPTGRPVTLIGCLAALPVYDALSGAYEGHTDGTHKYGLESFINCSADKYNKGFTLNDALAVLIDGGTLTNCYQGCDVYQAITIRNAVWVAMAGSYILLTQRANSAIVLDNVTWTVKSAGTTRGVWVVHNGCALTITGGSINTNGQRAIQQTTHTPGPISIHNASILGTLPYSFTSEGVAGYTGDYNTFGPNPNFYVDDVLVSGHLAGWQALTGQDAHST
jgi:hypothetical protein